MNLGDLGYFIVCQINNILLYLLPIIIIILYLKSNYVFEVGNWREVNIY